jgi:hypothetical protein
VPHGIQETPFRFSGWILSGQLEPEARAWGAEASKIHTYRNFVDEDLN